MRAKFYRESISTSTARIPGELVGTRVSPTRRSKSPRKASQRPQSAAELEEVPFCIRHPGSRVRRHPAAVAPSRSSTVGAHKLSPTKPTLAISQLARRQKTLPTLPVLARPQQDFVAPIPSPRSRRGAHPATFALSVTMMQLPPTRAHARALTGRRSRIEGQARRAAQGVVSSTFNAAKRCWNVGGFNNEAEFASHAQERSPSHGRSRRDSRRGSRSRHSKSSRETTTVQRGVTRDPVDKAIHAARAVVSATTASSAAAAVRGAPSPRASALACVSITASSVVRSERVSRSPSPRALAVASARREKNYDDAVAAAAAEAAAGAAAGAAAAQATDAVQSGILVSDSIREGRGRSQQTAAQSDSDSSSSSRVFVPIAAAPAGRNSNDPPPRRVAPRRLTVLTARSTTPSPQQQHHLISPPRGWAHDDDSDSASSLLLTNLNSRSLN